MTKTFFVKDTIFPLQNVLVKIVANKFESYNNKLFYKQQHFIENWIILSIYFEHKMCSLLLCFSALLIILRNSSFLEVCAFEMKCLNPTLGIKKFLWYPGEYSYTIGFAPTCYIVSTNNLAVSFICTCNGGVEANGLISKHPERLIMLKVGRKTYRSNFSNPPPPPQPVKDDVMASDLQKKLHLSSQRSLKKVVRWTKKKLLQRPLMWQNIQRWCKILAGIPKKKFSWSKNDRTIFIKTYVCKKIGPFR